MTPFVVSDLAVVLPELWLAGVGMALLMVGVFGGGQATRPVLWLVVMALAVAFVLALSVPYFVLALSVPYPAAAFGGLFVVDRFAVFMKALVLIGAALTLILALGYLRRENMERFEYPVLILFATLGMMMMISANDLIALYVGLELQSLSLYVVAAFQRDSLRSTEAGLKYFVLGALSSGMLLYGCSMLYGFTGTTNFAVLADVAGATEEGAVSAGVVVGLVFVTAGLAFKISAVPFHMWTPDVYEGAPTPITAFFSVAPKIAAVALFLRILIQPFGELIDQWQQIVIFISIASMLLGAFAAIGQRNIKRLMAYGSIGHVGYALVGLAAATPAGVRGVIIYMAIYLPASVGCFGCILAMRRQERMVEGIEDLAGLARTQPAMAFAMAIFMFSMAGIPPLAGFFGKLYVFLPAIEAGLMYLAVIGVLTSVVAAFYYVRIVKIMYFDEPVDEPFDRPAGREISLVLVGTGLFVLLFFVYPGPVLTGAQAAATALFP